MEAGFNKNRNNSPSHSLEKLINSNIAAFAHSGLINPKDSSRSISAKFQLYSSNQDVVNLAHKTKSKNKHQSKFTNVSYKEHLMKKSKDIKKKYASYKPISKLQQNISLKNSGGFAFKGQKYSNSKEKSSKTKSKVNAPSLTSK